MTDNSNNSWWELFQASPYPAYVTMVQPPRKSIKLSSDKPTRLEAVALDDVLDPNADPDYWQPATFELRQGSCVFVLPEDASSPEKSTVSEPWMVRVNQLWHVRHQEDKKHKEDKAVRVWEQQQVKTGRLSVLNFQVDMTYFYRLSDLYASNGMKNKKNIKTLCNALVTLGVSDTEKTAEALIGGRGGVTAAKRLLQRCVCFSTHEGKLQEDDSDSDSDDDDDDEQEVAEAPIPMEAVMAPFKVFFLGGKQRLPYRNTPVPAAVKYGAEARHVKGMRPPQQAELLERQQQEHVELPPGFFCSLIYVKQAHQLFSLEEWAAGTAGANIKGPWVQHSRKQVKALLAETKKELQQTKAGDAGVRNGQAAPAAAAAGSDSDEGWVTGSEGDAEQGVGPRTAAAATPDQHQQQHSHQGGQQKVQHQPQRKTPRKSQRPRRTEQQPEQQLRRGRLRRASQIAAADDGGSSGGASSSEAEEEEVDAADENPEPAGRKRRRAAAAEAPSSDADDSDDVQLVSSRDDGLEADGSSDDATDGAADGNRAAAAIGGRAAAAAPAKGRQQTAEAAAKDGRAGSQRKSRTALRSSKTAVLRTPKT